MSSPGSDKACNRSICNISSTKRKVLRQTEDGSVSQAKRPKGWSHVVDELPVRSRISPPSLCAPAAASASPGGTTTSYFPTSSCSGHGNGPPIQSLAHSSALTSNDTALDEPANGYPRSKEQYQASAERFAQYRAHPGHHIGSFTPRGFAWRRMPVPGLNEAPLAVIWEVTRFLQHCNVDAEDYALTYEANEQWTNQSNFRAMHLNHGPFMGKRLPPSSGQQAWELALDGFQSDFKKYDANRSNRIKVVTLSAELMPRYADTGPHFEFRLKPLELGHLGHRLSRRFGADRFLEITMPSPLSLQKGPDGAEQDRHFALKLIQWLVGATHHFLGRTWSPFFCQDTNKTCQYADAKSHVQKVWFFAVDGDAFHLPDQRGTLPPPEEALMLGSRTKMELHQLLSWAINMKRSLKLPILKLFSRLALSLSRTWPTVLLERHQILICEKDIGTHEVMNDGIGRMSRGLAKMVASFLPVTDTPSGYQARIGSAKGMWIIDSEDEDPEGSFWLELYPSQIKWKCDFEDEEHRRFEVNDWPQMARSARLNQQFILVLEEQASNRDAMRSAIKEHLENGLAAEIDTHTAALGNPLEHRQWLRRTVGSRPENVLHGQAPFLAGLPKTDEQAVAYLLDAGFDARHNKYIQELSWKLTKLRADQLRTKSRILVPQSAYLLMVADFASVLEEGEVSCTFSNKFQVDGFCDTLVEGVCALVGRSPAHLPSDLQVVKVVSHPFLRRLKDVVVFSTKGKKPLAGMLSGGDYDGDKAWICWDPKIVVNFRNAPVPECPDLFEMGYLKKLDLTVEYLGAGKASDDEVCAKFLYLAFLFNLQPPLLGYITNYKERMCYKRNSVSDGAATELSNLLGHLVDSRKQGILFDMAEWNKLRQERIGEPSSLPDPHYFGERLLCRRQIHCILDYLKFEVASKAIERALADFEKKIYSPEVEYLDYDLTKMYDRYNAKRKESKSINQILETLLQDIETVLKAWQRGVGGRKGDYATQVKKIGEMWLKIRPAKQATPLDMADWEEDELLGQWNFLKASATYKKYHKRTSFTWRIAGVQLCWLKSREAKNMGETAAASVHPRMWIALQPDRGHIARMRRADDAVAVEEMSEFDDDGLAMDDW